jgi:VWFA-related protein
MPDTPAPVALSLSVVGALALGDPADVAAQTSVFRSGVDIVPLTVTVTDAAGQYVTGLTGADFAVFEDGVPQSLSFFSSGEVPVDVMFVLDTGSSMSADMSLVRDSAHGLVRALREGGRGAVVAVNNVSRHTAASHHRPRAHRRGYQCAGALGLHRHL